MKGDRLDRAPRWESWRRDLARLNAELAVPKLQMMPAPNRGPGSGPEIASGTGHSRGIGLLLMLGAVTCFTAMVVCVKLLREGGMSTTEVMFWRMAPGLPWVLVELRRKRAPLAPRRPGPTALRALFGGTAMATYFWAVQNLSLLQNTVLQLAQPVFVAALSPLLLSERLQRASVAALALALGGACFAIVPPEAFSGSLTWALGLAAMPLVPGLVRLLSALFSALAHMMIRTATTPGRRRAQPEAPETVVLHFTMAVSSVTLALGLARGEFNALPTHLQLPETVGLVAGMATLGVAGQLMLSRAYAHAQAPAVAVVGYAAIPLSLIADLVVWSAPLQPAHAVAALLMVGAGILLVRSGRGPARKSPSSGTTRGDGSGATKEG